MTHTPIERIPFLSLRDVTAMHGDEISGALERVARSGWYLNGEETRAFEKEYASFIGTDYAVGCGNGLDALTLILMAYREMGMLRDGDEVIVPANTFIASFLAISAAGLTPVPVDPDPATFQIDAGKARQALSPRTRAIMTVHLYGRCSVSPALLNLCEGNGLLLIEDNAQAHGCRYQGRRTGSLGHAAAHSFYPGKNLGALGDGGAVTTSDESLAATVRELANYGGTVKYHYPRKGMNSRLDESQAAVLRIKLRHLDADNDIRRSIARFYIDHISHPDITLPEEGDPEENVWHIFPVLSMHRDQLRAHLAKCGVETLIHYPVPPHLQPCYRELSHIHLPEASRLSGEELSLPMSPALKISQLEKIVEATDCFRY